MLDRLPAAAEHAALLFVATFALGMCTALIDAGTLAALWSLPTVTAALDAAAVTTAGVLVLTFTTLTRRYGIGSTTR